MANGIESSLGSFWNVTSDEEWVFNAFPGRFKRLSAELVRAGEIVSGHQNRFQFWSSSILNHAKFLEADLVHLQVVHDHFLSLETVGRISRAKPTVWTWHDLWPVTGHCIFPESCPRLALGCGNCPDLAAPLPVFRDRTAAEFRRKHTFLQSISTDIHVTTDWMVDRVSPHLKGSAIRLHKLPFGVDHRLFQSHDRQVARKALGISDESFVIFTRSTEDPRKGFLPLLKVLDELSQENDITLVSVQTLGLAEKYTKHLKVIEFGWTNNAAEIVSLLSASDLFAMPSTGESFGMMALEAMSCARPVITVSGTATAEIVDQEALEVRPYKVQEDLHSVVTWAMQNREKLSELGEIARERALTSFSYSSYITGLSNLYAEVASRG